MTKNLQKILDYFDFCSNIYEKTITCYVREGNNNFTCSRSSALYSYISQENINDSLYIANTNKDFFFKSPECMNEAYIVRNSCSSHSDGYYIHIDPITTEEIFLSSSNINPITGQPEYITHSLNIGVIGNNCIIEITS